MLRNAFGGFFPLFLDEGSAGSAAGDQGSGTEDGKATNDERDALTVAVVQKMIENGLTAFAAENKKFFNKEMGDRRKEIEGITKMLQELTGKKSDKSQDAGDEAGNSGDNTDNSEVLTLKAENQKLLLKLELERSARKLGFAHPEEADRFVEPSLVEFDKVFEEGGKANQKLLEDALKATAAKYPALLGTRQVDNDNSINSEAKQKDVNAKNNQIAQRFGVTPTAPPSD